MVTNYNTALSKASEGTFRTVWGGDLAGGAVYIPYRSPRGPCKVFADTENGSCVKVCV